MRAARGAIAALRREQRGLTLIEMLLAAAVGLIVVGGALTVFMGAVRSEPRTAGKVAAIQQARFTVDRITRELRQGWETPTTTAGELEIETWVKATGCGGGATGASIRCSVTYSCSGETCTRVAQPEGGSPGPATEVASGLTDVEVFSYLPDQEEPTYVGVELALDGGGGEPVTLSDGVALRNLEAEEEEEA